MQDRTRRVRRADPSMTSQELLRLQMGPGANHHCVRLSLFQEHFSPRPVTPVRLVRQYVRLPDLRRVCHQPTFVLNTVSYRCFYALSSSF
jgi:hypothetical protein